MATNTKSRVDYEAQQTPYPFEQTTQDPVDPEIFQASFAPWSRRSGYEVTPGPVGIINGGKIVPDEGLVDDVIDIQATRAMLPGAVGADINTGEVQVSAGSLTLTRPAVLAAHIVSVIIDNTGSYAEVVGLGSTTPNQQAARGAAGAPPYIPVDACEIGQILMYSQTPAPILTGEISQVEGLSAESTDYPVYELDYGEGQFVFAQPPPNIHTGDVPKQVWVKGFTPVFAEQTRCSNFTPADNTHSVSSIQTFDTTIGSVSSSVGQGSFTAYMKNGISDPLAQLKDETLWFRFFQDRNSGNYILTNGTFGMARPYTAGEQVVCNCTISAEEPSEDILA